MVDYEEYKAKNKGSKGRFSKPRSRGGSSGGRGRSRVEMTKVTCSNCKAECEVPFKPTSSKPVYCDDCFGGKDSDRSPKTGSKDMDVINKKLDKIMKALDIE